eukprot:gnl/TRDRNA2_/TRDRNA2_60194_c0_seq1.p2 gnl/TRDRNA2_/TRDRNA2_60194_c0~~gnl/TRDRNA2_/TRDRNA2_60194_c0_seq1.p2  ORF type:complete len:123 (-),score=9.91 gnl/TRDRNA2_/TRDRNA2_60194_c0_seq1:118-486(-)
MPAEVKMQIYRDSHYKSKKWIQNLPRRHQVCGEHSRNSIHKPRSECATYISRTLQSHFLVDRANAAAADAIDRWGQCNALRLLACWLLVFRRFLHRDFLHRLAFALRAKTCRNRAWQAEDSL